MGISYDKLWKLLIDHKMNKSMLVRELNLPTTTMARMGKNQAVSLLSLEKICVRFNCNIGDIMEFVPDSPDEEGMR